MSQEIKNVVLIGVSHLHPLNLTPQLPISNTPYFQATGNLGTPILKALVEASVFNISILTRQSSTSIFPSNIHVHKTDYSEPDLVDALKGQDAIVSTIGGAGFQEQKKIIDAAVKAGVKRFLPSEFSANTMSPSVLDLVPLSQAKKDVLDYLGAKEGDGLSWTGIATGPMFDWVSSFPFFPPVPYHPTRH